MTERFDVHPTPIDGLVVLARKPRGDDRGYLERMYCTTELEALLGARRIAQINHTLTRDQGTVRGMHYQRAPHMETKMVSCTRGAVFDVAVDLRRSSKTFLKWHAEILSAENQRTFVIPEGFAHGFQTLSSDCEMLYFHTRAFEPSAEGGLSATDPRLAIPWPEPVRGLSPRDAAHPLLADDFEGLSP